MKASSTIHYTLEDKNGYAESYNDPTGIVKGNEEFIEIELKGENEKIKAPILKGYYKPYDFSVTDEIGTEHYIYYEEKQGVE